VTAFNIISFVLVLMVLVLVHEAGHMVAAKWCGMRVERFSIFFGRPLAKFRRGETEYGIGWLPLGGYVKITGMTRGEELPPELEERAYYNAKTWKKVVTIAAGPAVNLILAFLIFTVVFWIGPSTVLVTPEIGAVQAGSPAAAAGLRPGDRIVAVDGARVTGDGAGVDAARRAIQDNAGQPVTVVVQRGDERLRVRATPRAVEDAGRTVGRLGVSFAQRDGPRESQGFIGGFVEGGRFTWFLIEENAKGIGRLFTSEEARSEVGSVVAIGAVYNDVSENGWVQVLEFVGFISLVLAIFNLLPIFPLDGGHILFALIEKVRGKPISLKVYERSAMVGWAVILVVFVFALQNDIVRLTGEGFTPR
jgi:regulator of sigma E protease